MSPMELRVCRKQTVAFIKADPDTMMLRRVSERQSDGAGGWEPGEERDVGPITGRLVPVGTTNSGNQSINMDGETVTPQFVFIAEYDEDINKDDVLVMNNKRYDVKFVREDRDYEVWSELSYSG